MNSQACQMCKRSLSISSIFRYRYYSDTEKNYDFRRRLLENSSIKKFFRKEVDVEKEIELQKKESKLRKEKNVKLKKKLQKN